MYPVLGHTQAGYNHISKALSTLFDKSAEHTVVFASPTDTSGDELMITQLAGLHAITHQ
jgi:hypothetical protein